MKKLQTEDCSIIKDFNKIELIDTLDTEESKEDIIIPYLTGLYNDLVLRSDDTSKGIPRVTLTDVFLKRILVFEYPGHNSRTCFCTL